MKTVWNIFNVETNKGSSGSNVSLGVGNNNFTENPEEVARLFCQQFSVPQVPGKGVCPAVKDDYPTLFLNPVDEQEVFSIIRNLPNKFSAGLDEIPVNVLRHAAEVICRPLTDIINECLNTGVFPSSLKSAKVVPVFKKGDRRRVENYRPVSLLSSVSKIFEKVIYKRIWNFLCRNAILTDQQYGFRPGRSTELAIFNAVCHIVERLDQNERVAGLYFDLSKAFDTIEHGLLLQKLAGYGVRGVGASLIASYLHRRKQVVCVKCDGRSYFSEVTDVRRGVPQGSILGPLLFLLYSNDLGGGQRVGVVCQYADDTSVVLSDLSLEALSGECSRAAEGMQYWCQNNFLRLNVDKTAVILFSKTKIVQQSLYAKLCHKSIPQADTVRFLGVNLDSTLSWDLHIRSLQTRLNKACGIVRRLREVLTTESLRILYFSYIQSLITYSILFWGSSSSAIVIFRAQKRVVRCILKLRPRTSCRRYFERLQFLTVPSLYFLSLVMFVKKNSNLFRTNLQLHDGALAVLTRSGPNMSIPLHRSSFFERGPYYRAIKAYNMLPSEVRDIERSHIFRSAVISFLRERCFYSFNF